MDIVDGVDFVDDVDGAGKPARASTTSAKSTPSIPSLRALAAWLRAISLAFVLAAAAAGCGGSASSSPSESKADEAADPRTDPLAANAVSVGQDFNLMVYNDGRLDYRIEAKKVYLAADQSTAKMQGVRLVQFEDDKESAWATSDRGTYYMADVPDDGRAAKDVVLQGSVDLKRSDGFSLKTNEAVYEAVTRKMLCIGETYVKMPLSDGRLLVGDCAQLDLTRSSGDKDIDVQMQGMKKTRAHATIKGPGETTLPAPTKDKAK